jgi:hypothetical protein
VCTTVTNQIAPFARWELIAVINAPTHFDIIDGKPATDWSSMAALVLPR